jgi:putative ABC transport system permease protein
MRTLTQDLRYALRALRQNPAFTAIAVLTLALGIGGVTAIFSVVNAVLLSRPPFADPDRLLVLTETNPQAGTMSVAWPNFEDWRRQSRSFAGLAAYQQDGFNVTLGDGPVRLAGARVSANLFPLLGIRPALGRTFTEEEDRPGAERAVLLTYGAWRGRFGGDPAILGRSLKLDGLPYTVVGVLPPDFRFLPPAEDLFVPAGLSADDPAWTRRGNHNGHLVVGRLRPGVSAAVAAAEMSAIARGLEARYPVSNSGVRVHLEALEKTRVGDVRSPLAVLLAAVLLVLAIACANVANLLLAAGAARRRELAIRSAIGADRRRIVRQLLTESVVLSVGGGALGVALAIWGVGPLAALAPADISGLGHVRVDGAVLAFALGVSVLTGLVFGLAPALQTSDPDLQSALKLEGRSATPGRSRQRLRAGLLVAEVALALMLLAGAGLMVRTMLRLRAVDPGFDPSGVLALTVVLPETRYATPEGRKQFFDGALERMRALPGVRSAEAAFCPPLGGGCWGSVYLIEGRPTPAQADIPSAAFNIVTPGYFEAMGIPLREGRAFDEADRTYDPPVIVVNEAMARLYWPQESALGKRIKQGFPEDDAPYREIVGVVADVPQEGLDVAAHPEVYEPYAQHRISAMTLMVSASGEPERLARTAAAQIGAIDPDQPVQDVQPLSRYVADSVARRRFYAELLGGFAGLALFLAAIGVAGVVSYGVAQRRGEIGIRLALGAERRDVLVLILGQGMRLVLTGEAVGLLGALGLTRVLANLLFGVGATDAATFAGVSALLAAVALVACWLPARRAVHADPLAALRSE